MALGSGMSPPGAPSERVSNVMRRAPSHRIQMLTKRAEWLAELSRAIE